MEGAGEDPLHDRLRRLRRDPAREKRERSVGPQGMPPWLKARLAARRAQRGEGSEAAPAAEKTVGPPARLADHGGPRGAHVARLEQHRADHRHGRWRLADVDHASRAGIAHLAKDPALVALDLRRAVYLDIETTGLSGGAGTIPFLVGLGTFAADGIFTVWQGFLRGPEEEAAMLAATAERIAGSVGMVTFFGKSFDRHRLEDKMRIHGIEPPFASLPHLDLYHPLRRLYGGAFPDARLATMERELCGVERGEDLPGRFAPEAWFDYLGGRAHRLEGVLQHNLDDVLSLVTLAAHLGRTEEETRSDGSPLSGPPAWRARGLSRLAGDAHDRASELVWSTRSLERDPSSDRPWRLRHAHLLRRARRHDEALALYAALAEETEDEVGARALLETAKIAEHHTRDLPLARTAVIRARRVIERSVVGGARSRLLADCEARANRLGISGSHPGGDPRG